MPTWPRGVHTGCHCTFCQQSDLSGISLFNLCTKIVLPLLFLLLTIFGFISHFWP